MAREEFAPGCFRDAATADAAPADRRIGAVFRPGKNDIALFAADGASHVAGVVTLFEAQALHDELGCALRISGFRAHPLGAVEGERK